MEDWKNSRSESEMRSGTDKIMLEAQKKDYLGKIEVEVDKLTTTGSDTYDLKAVEELMSNFPIVTLESVKEQLSGLDSFRKRASGSYSKGDLISALTEAIRVKR